jgi:hypothetical protein
MLGRPCFPVFSRPPAEEEEAPPSAERKEEPKPKDVAQKQDRDAA